MTSDKLYNMSKMSYRRIKLRVDLLSFSFQVVGNLEGNSISGSIKIDANADIRRVADISLVVTDSSFDVGEDKKIWLDKYIQIYVGMVDNNGETEWINMGIYLIDNPSKTYNATTHTLSFQAYDLMSKMTGLRNGQLPGIPTLIPAGSSIRGSMASAVSQLGGFNRFIIEDNPQSVPYDIKIETGGYVYDIISKLRDISPNWETFFDVDGVFHYQPINAYYDNEIIADSDILNLVITNIENNVNFENVKNVIEVFGKSLEPNRYGDVATLSGSTYSITLDDFDNITPNLMIGFTTPNNNGNVDNAKLKINNLTALPLINEDGSAVSINESNEYFVVMNKSRFLDASNDSTAAQYSATAQVDSNVYTLSIPSLTAWSEGALINMTVPSMKLVLNNNKTYTISGSNVAIPNSGEICYIKITGNSTATFVSQANPTYNISSVTANGLTYYVNVEDISSFRTNNIIRFEAPYIEKSPNIKLNDNMACQIYDENNSEQINLIQLSNHTYKIKIPSNNGLLFLGHQQIHAEASDTNVDSPYYIGKDIGEIRLVLKDGEYNNIYSDELAMERANYELYLHCRMEDTITLTLVPIYWLDVNQKIHLNKAGINDQFITKSINIDLSPVGTMSVEAIKFYPDLSSVAADGTRFSYIKSLESTGTQYINTLINPTEKSKAKIETEIMVTEETGNRQLMGLNSNPYFGINASGYWEIYSSSGIHYTDGGYDKIVYYLEKNVGKELIINNNEPYWYGSSSTTLSNGNIYLFRLNYGTAFYCHMKMKYFKIWLDNELVRDYAPIIDEHGEYGLYDKIERKIFYNQGTGEFIGEN